MLRPQDRCPATVLMSRGSDVTVKCLVLMFAASLAAASTVPRAASAFDPPPPCDEFTSDDFRDTFCTGNGRVEVMDVGSAVEEPGNKNRCSAEIDTSMGRVRLTFTTSRSVNGLPMWSRVGLKIIY